MLKICKYVYHIAVKYDLLLYYLVCYTISYTITICYLVFYTGYNRSLYLIVFTRPCLASPGLSPARLVQARLPCAFSASRHATQNIICLQIRLYGVKTPYNALYAFIEPSAARYTRSTPKNACRRF